MVNFFIAQMIANSGRSWWQTRYSDGKILSEWDTLLDKTLLPQGLGRSSRWEEVPKKGMIGLRLLTSIGLAAELEAPEGFKFFQLKVGYFDLIMNKGGSSRSTAAHIIGVVQNADGDCLCRAWEHKTLKLTRFFDNIYNMKYENIARYPSRCKG